MFHVSLMLLTLFNLQVSFLQIGKYYFFLWHFSTQTPTENCSEFAFLGIEMKYQGTRCLSTLNDVVSWSLSHELSSLIHSLGIIERMKIDWWILLIYRFVWNVARTLIVLKPKALSYVTIHCLAGLFWIQSNPYCIKVCLPMKNKLSK